MKKWLLCSFLLTVCGVSYQMAPINTVSASGIVTPSTIENYIHQVYTRLDFTGCEPLSEKVFSKAFKGYINLKQAGELNDDKQFLTVVDFSKSSKEKRMWLIDVKNKNVMMNDYVAHGQGTGEDMAVAFSNRENSHQSSMGFYVTGNIYQGKHGASLKLHGMDKGYNCAAYKRAIVIHGADYVSEDFIKGQNRLGRSWGCPAVAQEVVNALIHTINDGTCLFIYYPDKKYLANAYWLNKKINFIPERELGTQNLYASTPYTKKDSAATHDEYNKKAIQPHHTVPLRDSSALKML